MAAASARPDFAQLAAQLLTQSETLVPQWLPAGVKQGHEWVCGDLFGSAGDSCKINLNTGRWADFAADTKGGDLIALYAAIHNLSQGEALRQLFPEQAAPRANGSAPKQIDSVYPYCSSDGELLYEVVRFHPKDFRQRRPDGDGGFTWNLKGVERVLYRLPEVLKSLAEAPQRAIFIPEGERDVDNLVALGCIATTNAQGAGKGNWSKFPQYTAALEGANVVILPDNDEPGKQRAGEVAHALVGHAARIRILMLPGLPEKGDVSDWIGAGGTKAQLAELVKACADYVPLPAPADLPEPVEPAPPQEPRRGSPKGKDGPRTVNALTGDTSAYAAWDALGLQKNSNGTPVENLENTLRILRGHPELAGRIWADDFLKRILTTWNGPQRQWKDGDDLLLTAWLQRSLQLPKLQVRTVQHAVEALAYLDRRHALREWIEGLTWDGVERLPHLLADGFGAVFNEYTAHVGRCWFISMIARALTPGCKADYVPVLEGLEGIKKSTALQILGGEWFVEIHEQIMSKDFLQAIQGVWLVEIAELNSFSGTEIRRIKGVISCQNDHYRASYGRRHEAHPRQCVFVATTNERDWNASDTGARRFWPVECTKINEAYLRSNRDQLFAEALSRFRAGEKSYDVPPELAKAEQEARRPRDIWEDKIRDYLKARKETTCSEVLSECIQMPTQNQDMRALKRVGRIMRMLKWESRQTRRGLMNISIFYPQQAQQLDHLFYD